MRDRAFAGLLLIAAAVYFGIWYWRRKSVRGITLATPIGPATSPAAPAPKSQPRSGNIGDRLAQEARKRREAARFQAGRAAEIKKGWDALADEAVRYGKKYVPGFKAPK